jgi:hypothetical protein
MDVYYVLPEQFVVVLAGAPVYAPFQQQDVPRQSRARRSESRKMPKPLAKLQLPMTSGDPGLAGNKFPASLSVLGHGLISSVKWSNSQTPSIFPRDIFRDGTRR